MTREEDKMRAHDEHRRMWRKARRSEKPLTPKQRVLKKHPKAFSMKRPFGMVIYKEHAYGEELGCAITAAGAWKAAAQKLRTVERGAE
jgi:hypothetical protein